MNEHFNLSQAAAQYAGRASNKKRKTAPMGLFKPDLYRAFFLGFGITALVMGAKIVPQML